MIESRTNEVNGDVAEIIANLASSGIVAVVELITILVERRAVDPKHARDILSTMAKHSSLQTMLPAIERRTRSFMVQPNRKGPRRR
ncbi:MULTISPECIES: hypothetical protein [Bradyrhizobium]|uniref:Uncharacterized protein n=2 Tax=Bradyrhizobium TaxID=374 RepID=A0ABY0Q7V5_9BRAD|nr:MULTISPECIES: hypothetical protein [Bradyrhizobium]SDJ65645.1 hypothetical protein SAMN05444163_6061 [Bradyrhizobium ottawaense]SEC30424.1 hypothetical protein SAMN05444171_1099 [Bradyrhizobium lablabi]